MSQRVLISGYGSMGQRHAKILSKLVKKKKYNYFNQSKTLKFSYYKKFTIFKQNQSSLYRDMQSY